MVDQTQQGQAQPQMRDVLFGDLPVSRWPGDTAAETEPWLSFVRTREHLGSGRVQEAVELLQRIVALPELESRHVLQAWHLLRGVGVGPDPAVAKQLLGVVVEVALPEGLDLLAAYADGTARYFNYSGAAVIWDAPDDSLRPEIDQVLRAGQAVVEAIGLWEGDRPPAPPAGQVRVNLLTPGGLYFGQGPFAVLAGDPLGGPVIAAATRLMQRLIAKAEERAGR